VKIRRFYGKDMRDVLKQVKDELGGDAVIMSNKKHADGIEIVAAYDKEPNATLPPKVEKKAAPTEQPSRTPTLSEIIGDSGPDSLKALLEKQAQQNTGHSEPIAANTQSLVSKQAVSPPTKAKPVSSVLSNEEGPNSRALKEMRQELSSLRNILQFQVSGLIEQDNNRKHPLHSYLVDKLLQMGISHSLAEEVVAYAPESADERQSWLFLLKLLANRLQTKKDDILSKPGVVALMGPTGNGKTTTVAKLAAQGAQKYGAEQVAIITIDNYRIGAFEQIATYGKIIGCAVKKAANANDLADLLYQFRNKRLVLIDTAGFGQKDARLIKQLDTINQKSCGNIRKYLVIQANCQYRVMQETLKEYKQVVLQGCIFTKLDECYSLGEAISVAIENQLQICYLTNGQKVPEDMQTADTKFLITSAARLYKNFGLIHTGSNSTKHTAVAV
jgi:flagellar biosynthesis protein FlhF